MATRRRVSARKQPQQQRSRSLVDTLLVATARILEEKGLTHTTTNEIARVAGVSVGSLYQYFPSKEALAVALIERQLERTMELITATALDPSGQPFSTVVARTVHTIVTLHERDRGLMRALLQLVPQLDRHAHVRQFVEGSRGMLRGLLETHREQLRPGLDLELASFIVIRALEELCHAAIFERPELLADPRFVDELTHLTLAYLGVREPAARPVE
ncbi:TetR/AcrR family transcriptional regulator [Myxococcaceae bacterium GXIMD 01537]